MMQMMMMKSRSSNSSSKEESTMTEEDLLEKKPSLDPQLWHACAGGMVQMPAVDTRVYYYPQGHAEHAATPPDFDSLHKRIPSTILCRVLSVKYLADTETDEVYARMRLVPVPGEDSHFDDNSQDNNRHPSQNSQLAARNGNGVSGPSSFAKTLTQSDANNGGGFSVPRYCAETIFPRLDYSSEPPVQTVLARDVHGEVWKFRHIYRGTPRRHLLTTGWSTFVNQKKLVAGDAIVFLRSASGELCVGVRRSTRNNTNSSGLSDLSPPSWHLPPSYRTHSRWELKSPSETVSSGFSRNRGRVSAKSVLEAASRAASGQPFEVVYYPRASTPEFCVKARSVKLAMGMHWSPGMRFKMAFETEDSSRISWFMGTISSVQLADPVHWPNSPWRLLQVTWDEPDILQNVKRVSPWLVELVSTMPPIQMTPFTLPKKKLRVTQPPEFQLENRSIMELQMGSTLGNNLLRQFNPWQSVSESVPAGMQGARQDRFYGFSLPDFCINKSSPGLFVTNPARQEQVAATAHVSTELNIGNSYQHEAADMQSSISCLLSVGNSTATQQKADDGWSKNSKAMNGASFLLFGKPIHAGESPKSNVTMSTVDGNFAEGWKKSSSIAGNNDVLQRVQQLMAGKKDINNFSDNSVSWFYNGESLDSTGANSTTTFNWVNDQSSATKLEKDSEESTTEDNTVHCKVFKETEEVGRTLDLSLFGTYEQLYDKLAKMFGVNVSELLNRVLYKGMSGSVRHAGDEPYKDFMKNVRRLTILSETGSDNMAR